MDIFRIIFPVIVVGGIGVFVVSRLKTKYHKGTLGKKNSKRAQNLLDSLIPLGMLLGTVISVLISLILDFSLSASCSFGAGFGLLIGYFAYEIYSKKGTSM